jgi:hypothetical protein
MSPWLRHEAKARSRVMGALHARNHAQTHGAVSWPPHRAGSLEVAGGHLQLVVQRGRQLAFGALRGGGRGERERER